MIMLFRLFRAMAGLSLFDLCSLFFGNKKSIFVNRFAL